MYGPHTDSVLSTSLGPFGILQRGRPGPALAEPECWENRRCTDGQALCGSAGSITGGCGCAVNGNTHILMHTHMHIYTCTHRHLHTCTYTGTHTRAHTRMHPHKWPPEECGPAYTLILDFWPPELREKFLLFEAPWFVVICHDNPRNQYTCSHTHHCTCAHTRTHASICTHTDTHAYTHTDAHMFTHSHTHIYAHTHMLTHAHTHVHTC